MFNVADGAVGYRDLAMDSLSRLHSPGYLIVADETSISVDVEVIIVAAVAAVWILQALVSDAEATGHVIDLVVLSERRRCARDQNRRKKEEKDRFPVRGRTDFFGNRARGIVSSQCTLAPDPNVVISILTHEYLNYCSS